LGRIGDPQAVALLEPVLLDSDGYVAFSARQALRRIGDWKETAKGLKSADPKLRLAILAAMDGQYDAELVGELAGFALGAEHPTAERVTAILGLCEVHRKAPPWDGKWWGTRPTQGSPPAKIETWQGTAQVIETLKRTLADSDPNIRLAAVKGIAQTKPNELLPELRERFGVDTAENVRRELALAFGTFEDKESLPLLIAALRNAKEADTVRDAAIRSVETIGTDASVKALVDLLAEPDLAVDRQRRVIAALAKSKSDAALNAIVAKLASLAAVVRADAAAALGKIGKSEGVAPKLRELLTSDSNAAVKLVVLRALGEIKDREAIPLLLAAADGPDTHYAASLALTAVPDIRAFRIYLQGLTDKNKTLRDNSSLALAAIRDQAVPILDRLAERRELPPATLPELHKIYSGRQPIAQWHVLGPFALEAKPAINPEGAIDLKASVPGIEDKLVAWKQVGQEDARGKIDLNKVFSTSDRAFAFGYAELQSMDDRKAEMLVGSDDSLTVWVNGKQVYEHKHDRGYTSEEDRLEVALVKGTNRILVKCGNHGGSWAFGVSLTTPVEYAFLKAPSAGAFNPDVFREFALKGSGKPGRGKELFEDLKGLACAKCHAVGGKGGAVGPDLTGVGAKYARDEIIASVLYPSAKIFSGYEPVVVATADGRVLTGIIKSDTPEALEIEDSDARRIKIPKGEIEERKTSDVSLMPNGLAEGLSKEDFADVISYLESLKEKPAGTQ
jgi:putative heme-binding domain-containing protein